MKKMFNDGWQFRKAGTDDWKTASVPGCNYLDLMNSGDIPDPFDGVNEKDVYWVAQSDWEYKKSFTLSDSELQSDDIILHFAQLDTVCDVFVNGTLAGKGENCFIGYDFSIKDLLKVGENEISVYFYSPVKYVEKIYKSEGSPVNSNGQNGIVHIRKPQYHFGWDWGPVLPPSGISGDVTVEFVRAARLNNFKVTQEKCGDEFIIKAFAEIKNYGAEPSCKIAVTCPDGTVLTSDGETAEFKIQNPELWWTHELSGKAEQPLYAVKAELISNGEAFDTAEKKVGLRTIELNRERDKFGRNFQFILNGVPLFIKGASYIPSDSFMTRYSHERINKMLDAAQFANMNMLRVWGGGFYESDLFYDECDRRGLLIWQDFMFACQAYPFFKEDYLENVKREIKFNVSRLSHHASLAVWCGNNEIEDMHMAWVHMRKYVDWTEKFFYHILEPEIRKYDSFTPYTPTSPCGEKHNSGVGSDNVGDTHLWSVWHGLQPMTYYRKRMTRFCSEFGFESLPDFKTIQTFAEPSDYSLDSEVFKSHQKCMNGNDKMVYYILSRFRLPQNFKDYVYLSQVTQQECISDATEHWRRNKGRCNGSMYWQFNDCWPVCSWSGIDYYGNYKALQYAARRFNAPVSVSVEDTENYIKIFALNDLNEPVSLKAEYEIFDFSDGVKERAERAFTLGAVKNTLVFTLGAPELKKRYNYKTTGIRTRLCRDGVLINEKTVLFDKERNLKLPDAKISLSACEKDGKIEITVGTDSFARLVSVESSVSVLPFSDNFFDLLPNETKTIIAEKDESIDLDTQLKGLSAYCCGNIKYLNSNSAEAKAKLKVWLSVVNIANAVHHGKIAEDYKFED